MKNQNKNFILLLIMYLTFSLVSCDESGGDNKIEWREITLDTFQDYIKRKGSTYFDFLFWTSKLKTSDMEETAFNNKIYNDNNGLSEIQIFDHEGKNPTKVVKTFTYFADLYKILKIN